MSQWKKGDRAMWVISDREGDTRAAVILEPATKIRYTRVRFDNWCGPSVSSADPDKLRRPTAAELDSPVWEQLEDRA